MYRGPPGSGARLYRLDFLGDVSPPPGSRGRYPERVVVGPHPYLRELPTASPELLEVHLPSRRISRFDSFLKNMEVFAQMLKPRHGLSALRQRGRRDACRPRSDASEARRCSCSCALSSFWGRGRMSGLSP